MGKYTEDSKQLLTLVGGKENISAVTHCMTRMRFVLVDPKKADIPGIEAMKVVKGSFTQSGQFQVIIGNTVSDFYNDFIAVAGIEGVSKEAAKEAAKKNQNIAQRIVTNIAEIFAPLLPAIICGGLILGFRNCIGELKLFNDGTQTLADISTFWTGMYSFLWLIGEAIFQFLPVGITWSITKKMGTTQILGIVLGITLVSPQLLNAYDVASTAAADIPFWDFGFVKINMIGYQAQVIPAILAGFTLVYLERFFRKHCPAVISMIVVPFLSLIFTVIVAHAILGPIGWKIGDAISSVVYSGLTSPFRSLFALVFGLLYAPLVITGLHHMTNAIDLQLQNSFGGTILWPMIALSNIAQGSAVLAMIFLQKNQPEEKEVSVPACISCYLGVTEPAIFGVNLKLMFPFICGMIGSACAAIFAVSTNTMAFTVGVGGLPGILSIMPECMVNFAIAMVIAIVIPFVLTYIVGKKKYHPVAAVETAETTESISASNETAETTAASEAPELKAFLSGKAVPIEEVPDEVFATKVMGDGLAIDPTDNTVVAPAAGVISAVMEDSKHACGITLSNGMEVLIHVGLDTVAMNGDGFQLHVKMGQTVSAGTPLITFDPKKIKAAGHPAITMLVITSEGSAKNLTMLTGKNVTAGKDVIATFE